MPPTIEEKVQNIELDWEAEYGAFYAPKAQATRK